MPAGRSPRRREAVDEPEREEDEPGEDRPADQRDSVAPQFGQGQRPDQRRNDGDQEQAQYGEQTDRDGQPLFELCGRLLMKHGIDSTRQAISQHLEVLEAAGLVRVKRDGRYKFHYLDSAPLRQITERWPIRD